MYWNDPQRGKEDTEARKQEERHRKKPILSLDEHKDSVTELMKRAAPI